MNSQKGKMFEIKTIATLWQTPFKVTKNMDTQIHHTNIPCRREQLFVWKIHTESPT